MEAKNRFKAELINKYWKNQIAPATFEGKFIDTYFPPNNISLLGLDSNGKYLNEETEQDAKELKLERIEWKRVSNIFNTKNYHVFQDKIECDDIKQGILGNCYFLSALASITEFPYLIYEAFKTKKANEFGYYEMILFIDGEWQIVFVDDYFPVYRNTNQFAFAKPNGLELWVILLEKAWAKVNGGYVNTIGGIVSEPLYTLTGFSTEYIVHSQLSAEDVWAKVKHADTSDLVMCCNTKAETVIAKYGLVEAHAYTLIDAFETIYNKKHIQLLKIRNPWGYKEWNGDWSDNSSLWTPELRKRFNHQAADDGTFCISLHDFINFFHSTYICHIMYNSFIKCFKFDYEKYFKHPVVINFQIKEDCKVALSVIFKTKRFNQNLYKNLNINRAFSLIVAKYDDKQEILSLDGDYTAMDNIECVRELTAGNYVVMLHCAYEKGVNERPFQYIFRICSEKEFESKFMGIDTKNELIQKLFIDYIKKTESETINSCENYYMGCDSNLNKAGISSLIVINKSKKKWMKVRAMCEELVNIQLMHPYSDLNNFEVMIPPGQGAAVPGLRLSYNAVDFNFRTKTTLYDDNKPFTPLLCEDFLPNDFDNCEGDDGTTINTFTYYYVTQKQAKRIPVLISTATTFIEDYDKDELYSEDRKAMSLIETLPDYLSNDLSVSGWTTSATKEGIYVGQYNDFKQFEGKGYFKWENSGDYYAGYWKGGKMHCHGTLFDCKDDVIYVGDYLNGERHGLGRLNFSNGDYYEGEINHNVIEGSGIYYWKNGNRWEGTFKNDLKHGVGVLYYSDGMSDLIEYENDNPIQRKILNTCITNGSKLNDKFGQKRSKTDLFFKNKVNYFEETLKKIIAKEENNNHIYVKKTEEKFEETPIERIEKQKRYKYQQFIDKDSFLFEELLNILLKVKDVDLNLIEDYNGYYIGEVDPISGVKQGYGASCQNKGNFSSNVYFVGLWKNGMLNGFGRKFDSDKNLVFEGNFIDDLFNGHGVFYYNNGDIYEGMFVNGIKNGKGTYKWKDIGEWEGNFVDGKFDGLGKFYYENSFNREMIEYNLGEIVRRFDFVNEEEKIVKDLVLVKQLMSDEQHALNVLNSLRPTKDNIELKWKRVTFGNGEYIGQVSKDEVLNGRGCFIWPDNTIKYHIGYYKDGIKDGFGYYFSKDFKLTYEGDFKYNDINGKGIYYYSHGDKYDGWFQHTRRHGKGVYYWGDYARWEGVFDEDKFNGVGVYVNLKTKTTEQVVYVENNIINRSHLIKHYVNEIKAQKEVKFNEISTNYAHYMKFVNEFEPVKDDILLNWTKKYTRDGLYIGQTNSFNQFHGRGILVNTITKSFYVGYFENGRKEKNGKKYLKDEIIFYEGEYHFNERTGKGIYYIHGTKEKYEGNFDRNGSGFGTYYFPNGSYWVGPFLNHKLHGKGKKYSKEGKEVGELEYYLNK